ncbi:hypothetical protein [Alkaliphilus serpentinus]|uniref:Uncharacterized protein n=1 Tax=Alkaliphilus serpentinus TaxID=1482731 RepID=A0A833HP07_9FIRM|nr:hypothetical protein [Alkaliphilus serpentinus]KAB3530220.1 hypothetical protein F8153_07320 [Alkaliphilus serpentinus]
MSIKSFVSKVFKRDDSQKDYVKVELEDLKMEMVRITDKEIPHEVTVVIPRVEIREKYDGDGNLTEREVILNSITMVHAPRHPLAGPPAPPPEIPERTDVNFRRR